MIQFVNIYPGTAAVTKQFFFIFHSKFMEQSYCLIRIHTVFFDWQVRHHKTVHFFFQCPDHCLRDLTAFPVFHQFTVISLTDGISDINANMLSAPQIVNCFLHQQRNTSAVCTLSGLIRRCKKRQFAVFFYGLF